MGVCVIFHVILYTGLCIAKHVHMHLTGNIAQLRYRVDAQTQLQD